MVYNNYRVLASRSSEEMHEELHEELHEQGSPILYGQLGSCGNNAATLKYHQTSSLFLQFHVYFLQDFL